MPSLQGSFSPEHGGVPRGASQGANALDAVSRFIARTRTPRAAHGTSSSGSKDLDATGLRAKLHRAVILAVHSALPAMRAGALRASPQHGRSTFFELLRFDFSIDAQGQPWLMEVNMSPNLMPKSFASGNDAGLKRSVVQGVLRVVGVGEDTGQARANGAVQTPTVRSSDMVVAAGSGHGRCDQRLCFAVQTRHAGAQPTIPPASVAAQRERCVVSAVLQPSCWGCRACFTAADERALHNFAAEMQRSRGGDFELVYPPAAQSWSDLQLEPVVSVLSRSGSRLDNALRTALRHNDTLLLDLRNAK